MKFPFFSKRKKKIALSLSGGAIKASLYLGAIKAFEENDIEIDIIGGLSGGAIMAAGYALYKDSQTILDLMLDFKLNNLLDLNPFDGYSVLDRDKFEKALAETLNETDFSECKVPLLVFATKLGENVPYIFTEGDLAKALIASLSLPPFLSPYEGYEGIRLVDGGLSIKFGAKYFRERGADIVIGIDTNQFEPKHVNESALMETFEALNSTISQLEEYELKIDPVDYKFTLKADLLGLNFLNFDKHKEDLIEAGYQQTLKEIPLIKKFL